MDHGPRSHGAGHGVEDNEEAAEERDVDAGGARAKEVESANDRSGEEAEADHGAELQKHTHEHASALVLEVRDDGGCRLPWTGPVGLLIEIGDGVEAGAEEHRVEDGEHAGVGPVMDGAEGVADLICVLMISPFGWR